MREHTVNSEIEQLHYMETLTTLDANKLTNNDMEETLVYLMFLTEKR